MSGLYIHIPFCRSKCGYCNFFSLASLRSRDALISALIREISWHKNTGVFNSFNTVYLGGGTPSLLEKHQLILLFKSIKECFHVDQAAEITLECNPDDLSHENLHTWKQLGINRLSIGIQSFNEMDLAYLDRRHNVQQAMKAVDIARCNGFDNLSIDLIYGIPGQSIDDWKQNLDFAIKLNVPHISAYSLTVEDRTILKVQINKGAKAVPEEDKASEHFLLLNEYLKNAGYEHYEISNFALPGAYSRHNTAYWQGQPYLGLGPSAHSYDGEKRWWNIAQLTPYLMADSLNKMQEGEEVLSHVDRHNEYIMTHLRTMWGCNMDEIQALSSLNIRHNFERKASEYATRGWMIRSGKTWVLTPAGMLLADGLAASFFIDHID